MSGMCMPLTSVYQMVTGEENNLDTLTIVQKKRLTHAKVVFLLGLKQFLVRISKIVEDNPFTFP